LSLWDDSTEVDEMLGPEGPAAEIWALLLSDEVPGFGTARTNKLLGRKRPHLFPVWDSVLQNALAPPKLHLWPSMRQALRGDAGRARLELLTEMRAEVGLPKALSPLRVLDVIVWMRNHGADQVDAHRHLYGQLAPGVNGA
jgi:hypothetical protein